VTRHDPSKCVPNGDAATYTTKTYSDAAAAADAIDQAGGDENAFVQFDTAFRVSTQPCETSQSVPDAIADAYKAKVAAATGMTTLYASGSVANIPDGGCSRRRLSDADNTYDKALIEISIKVNSDVAVTAEQALQTLGTKEALNTFLTEQGVAVTVTSDPIVTVSIFVFPSSGGDNTAAIVGGVIGGLVGVALIAFGVKYLMDKGGKTATTTVVPA
jgi:hypothetical protein